jgi:muramoyltetrapeptide carboxypeptidase LdcA involved in peptidoglycan recycling
MNWNQITYPKPIQKGSTIGVTAPSNGVKPKHEARLNLALKHLELRGFSYLEGKCLRDDKKSVSANAQQRAEDFTSFWLDPSVDMIFPPWGGEFLINILGRLDFKELVKNRAKWVQGYSDTSTLLFALTTITGIATVHGLNLMDSILENDDSLTSKSFDWLTLSTGARFEQTSSPRFQTEFEDFSKNVHAKFKLEHNTFWKNFKGGDEITLQGRMIGGCLDTLRNLVGTPYGDLPRFASRFPDSKVILYLENAGSTPAEVCRTLWNMRFAGWFEVASGVVFGRSAVPDNSNSEEFSYEDAIEDALASTGLPIILDADIGHHPPQMTIINGSMAQLESSNGRGRLVQTLI